jgi:uncharacterized protein
MRRPGGVASGENPLIGFGLKTLDDRLGVCRLAASAAVPRWATGGFVSVTRTAAELSVVCAEEAIPEEVTSERGWRCIAVEGPLSFELTGIVATLTAPLAEAGIPVFVLSTYDTDYLLVREEHLRSACAALAGAGHAVDDRTPNEQ